jgi:hypothetical protein
LCVHVKCLKMLVFQWFCTVSVLCAFNTLALLALEVLYVNGYVTKISVKTGCPLVSCLPVVWSTGLFASRFRFPKHLLLWLHCLSVACVNMMASCFCCCYLFLCVPWKHTIIDTIPIAFLYFWLLNSSWIACLRSRTAVTFHGCFLLLAVHWTSWSLVLRWDVLSVGRFPVFVV